MTDDRQGDPDFETVRKFLDEGLGEYISEWEGVAGRTAESQTTEWEPAYAALSRIQAQVESLKAELDYAVATALKFDAVAYQDEARAERAEAELEGLRKQAAFQVKKNEAKRSENLIYKSRAERAEAALREIVALPSSTEHGWVVAADIARAALNKSENVESDWARLAIPAAECEYGRDHDFGDLTHGGAVESENVAR